LKNRLASLRYFPTDVQHFLIRLGFVRISEAEGIVRAARRGDWIAFDLYRTTLVYFAIKLFHLIHQRYCPYRKWMGRSLKSFGESGRRFYDLVECLVRAQHLGEAIQLSKDILSQLGTLVLQGSQGKPDPSLWLTSDLNLLNFNYEKIYRALNPKISAELKKLPAFACPKSFWGLIFDMDGLGGSYETVLRDNLRLLQVGEKPV
jgi:hypothetical protein